MAGLEYVTHQIRTGLGYNRMLFSASPYETSPVAGDRAVYNYSGTGRRDMRWLNSNTTGNGWEHTFEIVGSKYRRDTLYAGRAVGVSLTQYANTNLSGGFTSLGFSTDSVNLYGIVKDEGGVNTEFLAPGVQRNTIIATTPDYSLGKQRVPRLPYLLKAIAQNERLKWAIDMNHSVAKLGFVSTIGDNAGIGFSGDDPFANFANYIDESTLTYTDVLTPLPANEKHFLDNLSVIYALEEYMSNHVLVNGKSIYQAFDIEIVADTESAIISIDINDGSPQSAILSALREGNFRYWWDNQCGMHLIPDYCNPGATVTTVGTLNLSKIAGLTINVVPGPPPGYPRVNRVYAEGVWSSPASTLDTASQTTPLKNWKIAPNKATYPVGQGLGLGGEDVSIRGAHLSKMDLFTHSEYNRLSQKARVQIAGFPYIPWAVRSYNRPVYLTFPDDPMGSFKGLTNGLYSLEEVNIQMQDIDGLGGGYPEATLTFQEIITA
jgi:hypothetical protein